MLQSNGMIWKLNKNMNDYQKDILNYSVGVNHNNEMDEPRLKDYDENGYKKGSVTYEDNLILDNYLIQIYGIEYARQHPLKKTK